MRIPGLVLAALLILAALAASATPAVAQGLSGMSPDAPAMRPSPESPRQPMDMDALDDLNSRLEPFTVEVQKGYDPVPPLDDPRFISVPDAGLSRDRSEIVFVVHGPEGVEIYPRLILARHEVVNLPGKPRRSLTYCPLTGSTQGYYGHVDMFDTTLGTTGKLVNSNRILYDRSTNSEWPQMLGLALSGPLAGQWLDTFPVFWTTWGAASQRWPEARVLSADTGFRYNYNKDPLGSYRREGTYYDSGGSYYRLSHVDTSVRAKERVLGLSDGLAHLAVIESAVKDKLAANIDFGTRALVAMYDPAMDGVRVFERRADSDTLDFDAVDGKIYDRQTRSTWSPEGVAVEGRLHGMRLSSVAAMECFWFAWTAFHPQTEIYR